MFDGNKKKPEKVSSSYPTGRRMKKGSILDCMGCSRKNPNTGCKGCKGKGYIVI